MRRRKGGSALRRHHLAVLRASAANLVEELHLGFTDAISYARSESERGRRVQARKLDAAGFGPAGEAFKSFICMAVFTVFRVARPSAGLLHLLPEGSRLGRELLGVYVVDADRLLQEGRET
jgi:hypothetical protein